MELLELGRSPHPPQAPQEPQGISAPAGRGSRGLTR